MENLPDPREIFVVDALLVLERPNGDEIECYLSDYPPLIWRDNDPKIKLNISEEVKQRLASRPELALGWHPYCRVLGQRSSFDAPERFVAPLLISFREPLAVSDTIAKDLSEEWDDLQVKARSSFLSTDNPLQEQNMTRQIIVRQFEEAMELREILRKEGEPSDEAAVIGQIVADALADRTDFGDPEYDNLSQIQSSLKDVEAFENSGMSGPLAFLIGLYYFLGITGQQSYDAWAREITAKLHADWPVEEWRKQLKYLRPAGVIRLDESGLEKITSVLDGP